MYVQNMPDEIFVSQFHRFIGIFCVYEMAEWVQLQAKDLMIKLMKFVHMIY